MSEQAMSKTPAVTQSPAPATTLNVAAGPTPATGITIGAGSDSDYGSGPLAAIVPPAFLERAANLDPKLLQEVDRAGLLALWKNIWPAEELKRLRDDPEFRAEAVLNQITPRARLASQLGMNHAVLYAVHPREIDSGEAGAPRVEGLVQPELLVGAAKLVWDHVSIASVGYAPSCQPTLDYWQSGIDNWAGHNIVIHFNTSSKVKTVGFEELAQTAIQQLPYRAVLECMAGRTFASALSFYDGDERFIEKDHTKYPADSERYSPGNVKPYMLKGPAKEVWDYCQAKNMMPTLEYWETTNLEGSVISGFEIIVHWYKHKNDDGTFCDGSPEFEDLKQSDPRVRREDTETEAVA